MKAAKIDKLLERHTNVSDNIRNMAYQLNAHMGAYESKCHYTVRPTIYNRLSNNTLNIVGVILVQINNEGFDNE